MVIRLLEESEWRGPANILLPTTTNPGGFLFLSFFFLFLFLFLHPRLSSFLFLTYPSNLGEIEKKGGEGGREGKEGRQDMPCGRVVGILPSQRRQIVRFYSELLF